MAEFTFFEMLHNSNFLFWANRKAYEAHCSQDLDDLLQQLATKLFRRQLKDNRELNFRFLQTTFCRMLISHTRSVQYKRIRRTCSLTNDIEAADNRNHERIESFRSFLKSLSVEQRQVLELRYLENHRINEIAQRISIPINTVKSHLRRALIQLRDTVNAPWN